MVPPGIDSKRGFKRCRFEIMWRSRDADLRSCDASEDADLRSYGESRGCRFEPCMNYDDDDDDDD